MSPNQDRKKQKTLRERISPAWAAAFAVLAVSVLIGLSGPQGVWFGLSAIGVIGSLLLMAYLWAEEPEWQWGKRKTAETGNTALRRAADAACDSEYQPSPLETHKGGETETAPWEDVLSVNTDADQSVTLRRSSTGVYALAYEVFRWPRTPSDSGGVELVRLEELPHDFPRGWTPEQFAWTVCQSEAARRACAGAPAVIRFFKAEEAGQNQ